MPFWPAAPPASHFDFFCVISSAFSPNSRLATPQKALKSIEIRAFPEFANEGDGFRKVGGAAPRKSSETIEIP